jgi:hypothetical protein
VDPFSIPFLFNADSILTGMGMYLTLFLEKTLKQGLPLFVKELPGKGLRS